MTSDPGIYLQSALEEEIESDWSWSPNWRIFSKLGAGYSSLRYRGEVLTNSYGCLPDTEGGLEFTLAIRTSVPLGRFFEVSFKLSTVRTMYCLLYNSEIASEKPIKDVYLERADLEAAEAARLIVKNILNENLS